MHISHKAEAQPPFAFSLSIDNCTRQMIITAGGWPDVHGVAWHAKREGEVYAHQ